MLGRDYVLKDPKAQPDFDLPTRIDLCLSRVTETLEASFVMIQS